MANEIKTRIQLKYDSYENWTKEANQFVVKKGEVCIAEVAPFTNAQNPSNATNGQHPVLFKVGNGSLTFNQLPWASALAADVHAWAKAEKAPDEYDTKYTFEINTAGALQVTETTYVNGAAQEPAVTTYDFVTPSELTKTLGDYYTGEAVKEMLEARDKAIEELESKIPTELGVMSINKKDQTAIEVDNTDAANPKVGLKLNNTNAGNVVLSQDNDGLKANIALATGDANGQVKIAGENVSVKGLAALAYKDTITKSDFTNFATEVAAVKVTNATNADNATTAEMASTAQKVEQALTIKVGNTTIAYDGSVAKTADVDAAIAAAIEAEGHPEYSIAKVTTTTGYSATYQLTKDGTAVGTKIDIPKDMVVSKGEVITYSDSGAWGNAGTYIVLTLANATSDTLYIPVDGLIEYVTSGSTAASQVIVAIDEQHKVTATIGAGKIGTTELADKAVTEDKLADAVKTAIAKDDNATYTLDGATSTSGATLKLVGAGAGAETTSILVEGDGIVKATYNSTDRAIELAHDKRLSGGHVCSVSGATINPEFGASKSFYVPYVDFDEYGHATAASDETITITLPALPENASKNTTYAQYVGNSSAHSNEAVTNPYLVLLDSEDNVVGNHQIKGAGLVNVESDASGNITITGNTPSIYDTATAAPEETSDYIIFNCGSASKVI